MGAILSCGAKGAGTSRELQHRANQIRNPVKSCKPTPRPYLHGVNICKLSETTLGAQTWSYPAKATTAKIAIAIMPAIALQNFRSLKSIAQAGNVTQDGGHILLGGPIGVGGGALPSPRCCGSFGRRHWSLAV